MHSPILPSFSIPHGLVSFTFKTQALLLPLSHLLPKYSAGAPDSPTRLSAPGGSSRGMSSPSSHSFFGTMCPAQCLTQEMSPSPPPHPSARRINVALKPENLRPPFPTLSWSGESEMLFTETPSQTRPSLPRYAEAVLRTARGHQMAARW